MTVGVLAFTAQGFALGERLCAGLSAAGYVPELTRCGDRLLGVWTAEHFASDGALVYIGAAGIAVRAVAPYVKAKTSDPAVLVIDEGGRFVIPLLSGHIGGANRLAGLLAGLIGAVPVITTATDGRGVFAVDTWAGENGIRIVNPARIKAVSAKLLAGETVRLKSDFPVEGPLPEGVALSPDVCDVALTIRPEGPEDALCLVPPVLTLGVGCRKGIPAAELEAAFEALLKAAGCRAEAVGRVCSIDLKAREPGLLAFCQKHGLPLDTFSADALAAARGDFPSSEFVRSVTGVGNVCQRSAVLGSGGALFGEKYAGGGVTMALAAAPYTVRFMEEV